MKWTNKAKVTEILFERLPAQDYKSDYKFDFNNFRLENGMVSGLKAFEQKFKKVLLTDETPMVKYGLLQLLPTSLDQDEFDRQCCTLSEAILNHKFSDSTPDSPNGLGHTVNKVYSIEYDQIKQKYTFVVGVEGEIETSMITFPAPSVFSK